MLSFLRGLLFDEAKFRRAACAVILAGAGFASTSAGAAVLDGKDMTTGQLARGVLVGLGGLIGGAVAVQGNGKKEEAPPAP